MSNRLWLSLGVFCSLLSSPFDVEGMLVSVKAYGMGGTGVAYPQDAFAGAYNPAGMVYIGNRTDIGVHGIRSSPKVMVLDSTLYNGNGDFTGIRGRYFATPDFGINTMVFDSVDVSVGVVAYTRDFLKASYDHVFPAFGNTHLMGQYWQGVLSPMAAMRFDKLAIGASFDLVCQTLKVGGLQNFDVPGLTTSLGNVTDRKLSFAQGYTCTLGIMWLPTRCLTLGAAYQFPRGIEPFGVYRGLIAADGKLKIPRRIVVGIRYSPPSSSFTLAGDIEHVAWSGVSGWHNPGPTSLSALKTDPFGTHKGPAFGWLDQFIAHVGADYKLCEGNWIRIGYRFAQELVRTEETFMNTLFCPLVHQILTLGFTSRLDACTEMSGYIAWGGPRTIHGKTVSADFGGGTYTLFNETLAGGFSMGWDW